MFVFVYMFWLYSFFDFIMCCVVVVISFALKSYPNFVRVRHVLLVASVMNEEVLCFTRRVALHDDITFVIPIRPWRNFLCVNDMCIVCCMFLIQMRWAHFTLAVYWFFYVIMCDILLLVFISLRCSFPLFLAQFVVLHLLYFLPYYIMPLIINRAFVL